MKQLLHDAESLAKLSGWLHRMVEAWPNVPVWAERLSGGSSASLFKVSAEGRHVVLRGPQVPPRPDSERALAREARVLRALAKTTVPHPRFLQYCEDEAIIGAPFLVLEWVDGWTGATPIPHGMRGADSMQDLAFSLIDALAELHSLRYQSLGLEGFGRPEGFLARQVDQWLRLFEQHRSLPCSRELTDAPIIAGWLRDHMPDEWPPAIVHGDASFSNVMFCYDRPPRVAAIIDWEIATIGDPRVDVGRTLYPFPDERGIPGVSMAVDHSGGPTRQSLVTRYAERTGRSISDLDFFMVLSMFKLAALIEPNFSRNAQGHDPTGFSGRVANFVPQLLHGARSIMDVYDHT